jgi:hypothetical protein
MRLMEQFQEIEKLARGLMSSFRTVLAAGVLILMTVYMLACFGMELINYNVSAQEGSEVAHVMQEHFSSMSVTMLTLVRCASGDAFADLYWPLVMDSWYLVTYFIVVWLVVSVVLMNLVAAVIVENTINEGDQDREMHRRMLRRKVHDFKPYVQGIFNELDLNRSGQLHKNDLELGMERIVRAIRKNQFGFSMPREVQDVMESDQLVELFEFLDSDGTGTLDLDEFLDGVAYLALQSIPTETIQTLHLLRSQRATLELIVDSLSKNGAQTATLEHIEAS